MQITKSYRETMMSSTEAILEYVSSSGVGQVQSQVEVQNGALKDDPRVVEGIFLVTSGGKRWFSRDLASAIVTFTSLNTAKSCSLWEQTSTGQRRLIARK